MDFNKQGRGIERLLGGGAALLLNAGLVFVLIAGMKFHAVEALRQHVAALILEEPERVPPPPPPVKPHPVPRPVQPLAYVPPPEVQIPQPPTQPVLVAVTNEKPPTPSSTIPTNAVKETVQQAAPVLIPAVIDARNCGKPEYPPSSYLNGEQGAVTLEFLIGVDGRVLESKVVTSSGYKELDRAAQVGLGLCKFRPGTVDGKPIQSRTTMKYIWKLYS